ncbi:MAG: hypothetical protein ACYS8W_00570 [Planctomycetota bacterium]
MKLGQALITIFIAVVAAAGITLIIHTDFKQPTSSADASEVKALQAKINDLELNLANRIAKLETIPVREPKPELASIPGGDGIKSLEGRVDALEKKFADINVGAGAPALGSEGGNYEEVAKKVIEEFQKNPEKVFEGMMDRRRQRDSSRMTDRLELDETQKEQYNTAMEEMRNKMRGLRDGGYESREEMMEAMRKIREDMDATMQEILTPEQYEKYKEMNQHGGMFGPGRGGRRGGRGGGNRGGGGDRGGSGGGRGQF